MKNFVAPMGFRNPWELASFTPNTPLAVALSGGADSVTLLSILATQASVVAVHVHHGIRGEEADRDAQFCRELTTQLRVPFHLLHVDAPALAAKTGDSLETAARKARYAALTDFMRQHNIPLLATAHHADDQLETMLQHLLRGSGTRGLCGIPACRPLAEGLFVVRPLLSVPKADILHYIAEKKLPFVSDSTNEELTCQRNFLRLKVLPLLLQLQPNAPRLAARCAEALSGDEAYLDELASDFVLREGSEPSVKNLLALPKPILVRVLRQLLPEPPTAQHVADIVNLLSNKKPHAALSLPPKVILRKSGDKLSIEIPCDEGPFDDTLLLCRKESEIKDAGALVFLGPLGKTTSETLAARYRYTTRFRIRESAVVGKLTLRRRIPGDVIFSGGMHKSVRRLKSLMHLPPSARAAMPLLLDGDGLLAIPFGPVRDGAAKNSDLEVHVYFNESSCILPRQIP